MRIEIKPEKAEGEAIKAAAKEAGESTQVYILQAVRNRMEAEKMCIRDSIQTVREALKDGSTTD